MVYSRASMRGQFFLLLLLKLEPLHALNRDTSQALVVIVVQDLGLVVVVVLAAPGTTQAGASTTAPSAMDAIKKVLVRIEVRQLVRAPGFDSGSRVGNKVVSEVSKSTLHGAV